MAQLLYNEVNLHKLNRAEPSRHMQPLSMHVPADVSRVYPCGDEQALFLLDLLEYEDLTEPHNIFTMSVSGIVILILFVSINISLQQGLYPAQIFARSTQREGENITIKCRISGSQNVTEMLPLHMYLCKNGFGIRMEMLTNLMDTTFPIKNVKIGDTGNYTCVYSKTKHIAKNVTGTGLNSIFITVADKGQKSGLSMTLLIASGIIILLVLGVFSLRTFKRRMLHSHKDGQSQAGEAVYSECQRTEAVHTNMTDNHEAKVHFIDNSVLYSTVQAWEKRETETQSNFVYAQVRKKRCGGHHTQDTF
ncbi:uncharacterized protein LOC114772174 [Denticeps clupeoides]|uniref:uncharacterized protein LOC114772174 n=1 Tax=Denticeps clupeoides TaxID=299321 RepID=UPI0010A4B839|nr:uncharacterized protein LOC114772174 [Denticeps clupeoides]